ncbi:protein MpECH2 [Marchantia polymorpha subsp. ruderalis]|uniref:MaoC-like domain-containing protein n=2 Tax=Marchantia polymorpha TaxID=3197 RepID=A0AAF6BR42_MARPO|nr:hypothetical protein MARPO_0135s0031 [Marchantia polymorpha]BBN14476.1 hypothetical protein Mp_6g12050 [Marchantia polymorpha subsp. ruderalis]|eukprot:PTQ29748.1 hypothetical protein MARPO_0135s0031 [Marchantia polymorpha]
MARLASIDPELVLRFQIPDSFWEYTEKDVALYALGVGAPGPDPVDPVELPFVYNPKGLEHLKVLPSFAVIIPGSMMETLASIDGLHYDETLLLHGEQYMEIYKAIPTSCKGRSTKRISGLHDKKKAAIVEVEVMNYNDRTGDLLSLCRYTIFLRGAGGFSPSAKPFSYSKRTMNLKNAGRPPPKSAPADVAPSFVVEDQSQTSQALLYRLSGDANPIHTDPKVAAQAGFERPIMMGLCTYGYAVRAIIRSCCHGDPSMMQSFQGRFLSHVYPGEKLTTEIWLDASRANVTYVCKAGGRKVLAGISTLATSLSRL